jgi:hypothetical protein
MEEKLYVKISEAEFRKGMDARLFPDEIEDDTWYKTRETCDDAKKLGCFALEAITQVKYIEPGDAVNDLYLQLLDADGQLVGDEIKVVVNEEGVIYDPQDPSAEGYLIEYDGYPDDKIEGVVERILAHASAPYVPLSVLAERR